MRRKNMSRQLGPWRQGPLLDLHRDLDRLFGNFWSGPGLIPEAERQAFRDFMPHLDVDESEGAFTVTVELPGLEAKDVDLSLTDDLLVIEGEKRAEATDEKQTRHRVERLYGRFQRAVRLPRPVAADEVEATFKSGVLTVTLPKSPEARQRRVPIQVHGD
jgi:HSP20 family protein